MTLQPMIVGVDSVRALLEETAQRWPAKVKTDLKEGDLVLKAWHGSFPQGENSTYSPGIYYEIDDPKIYLRLGNSGLGKIPSWEIYSVGRKLSKFEFEAFYKISGRNHDNIVSIPYSKAIEDGISGCTERGIAFQLAFQSLTEPNRSFIVNGRLSHYRVGKNHQVHYTTGKHTFNILTTRSGLYVCDPTNPVDGRVDNFEPFVERVSGMTAKGQLILPKNQSRIYSIL